MEQVFCWEINAKLIDEGIIQAIVRDIISDRKKSETALLKSEKI